MKTGRYVNIQDQTGWVRDTRTNALINTNVDQMEKQKEIKRKRREQTIRAKTIEEDINNLKSDMSEIKDLLRTMVGKNG